MKRRILLIAVCIAASALFSASAQGTNDNDEVSESEFTVERSAESAVVFEGKRYTLPEMIV
ncbi:MAG TPA: hypothetical protein PK358_13220, partial [Spirochaetota bacterium]|nr:hypothetical protein [Spirochaetota bacterium]